MRNLCLVALAFLFLACVTCASADEGSGCSASKGCAGGLGVSCTCTSPECSGTCDCAEGDSGVSCCCIQGGSTECSTGGCPKIEGGPVGPGALGFSRLFVRQDLAPPVSFANSGSPLTIEAFKASGTGTLSFTLSNHGLSDLVAVVVSFDIRATAVAETLRIAKTIDAWSGGRGFLQPGGSLERSVCLGLWGAGTVTGISVTVAYSEFADGQKFGVDSAVAERISQWRQGFQDVHRRAASVPVGDAVALKDAVEQMGPWGIASEALSGHTKDFAAGARGAWLVLRNSLVQRNLADVAAEIQRVSSLRTAQ